MFGFVTWLRAIAAVLITNAHYADIWPVSSLAFGGQMGNCLYFFLSGFCLFHIKDSFPKWYLRRIVRIYPAVWIVNTIDLLVGRTSIGEFMGFVHCYFYPTWFHFIGSIMFLYVLYYIARYVQKKLKLDMRWLILAVLVVYLILYVTKFDKSFYHIDNVEKKWVRFMFFESMLLGAWLRERYEKITDRITVGDSILFVVSTMLFFVGKIAFSRLTWLSSWQCVLQIILVLWIYSVAILFIKLEKRGLFLRMNAKVERLVAFVAGITLEIYLGQHLIIWAITGLPFPISFIAVTAAILAYGWAIHLGAALIQKGMQALLKKLPTRNLRSDTK